MCYFVTVGVSRGSRGSVEALGKNHVGLVVKPATNPFVARQFPSGHALYHVTHGGCSCDIYAMPVARTSEEEDAMHRARYRKKGWSEAKIARAIESRRRAHGDRQRADDRVTFCQAILALVGEAGSVRLFSHMYSGRLENEDVGPCRQLEVSLEGFARDGGAFPVDTVVHLSRRAG